MKPTLMLFAIALATSPSGINRTTVVPVLGLIDINAATPQQLETLPGVGRVYRVRIIRGRPYKGKGELLERKIVPISVYAKIRTRIIAKQK